MPDKTITCKDCNLIFIFNESEQAFYKEKGFDNEPQRCPSPAEQPGSNNSEGIKRKQK